MIILFIAGLLLGGAAVIFALENVAVITVTFFSWQFTSSLAVILILAIFSGVLVTLLLLLPESINNYFRYRTLRKENNKLKEELQKQKELTVFAKNTPLSSSDISNIEQGAIIN